jgi:hypothetical protein
MPTILSYSIVIPYDSLTLRFLQCVLSEYSRSKIFSVTKSGICTKSLFYGYASSCVYFKAVRSKTVIRNS